MTDFGCVWLIRYDVNGWQYRHSHVILHCIYLWTYKVILFSLIRMKLNVFTTNRLFSTLILFLLIFFFCSRTHHVIKTRRTKSWNQDIFRSIQKAHSTVKCYLGWKSKCVKIASGVLSIAVTRIKVAADSWEFELSMIFEVFRIVHWILESAVFHSYHTLHIRCIIWNKSYPMKKYNINPSSHQFSLF